MSDPLVEVARRAAAALHGIARHISPCGTWVDDGFDYQLDAATFEVIADELDRLIKEARKVNASD
jgi:hypothetical protein